MEGEIAHAASAAQIFLWIALLLLIAKLSGFIEKLGQPSVLGELVAGVLLGNLALLGIHFFDDVAGHEIIKFLAELGVVILLFQIGLESNVKDMKAVGVRAFIVAIIGVVVPFVLGTYLVGPWLMPGLATNTYLFLGAALVATSVGITARVFRDLGKLNTKAARIVLGAAVIDDVLGLIVLAVVSAIVTAGSVSVGTVSWITLKAILFLVGAIVIGQLAAPHAGKWFAKVHTGIGMKLSLAFAIGLIAAWLAGEIGLAPIVGAFAAGLVLDPVHFRFFIRPHFVEEIEEAAKSTNGGTRQALERIIEKHSHRHVEDLIEPLSLIFVPIFFVVTGMGVKLDALFNVPILLVALGITVVAIIGKIVAGIAAQRGDRLLVGVGMIPRGEVGLIFATIGKSLGVVSDTVFSVIVIMVILTTLVTPPILALLLKRQP